MSPIQLKETTMDKENSTLRQIHIEDFKDVETLVDTLMGKDSAKRKNYIMKNGHKVNLHLI